MQTPSELAEDAVVNYLEYAGTGSIQSLECYYRIRHELTQCGFSDREVARLLDQAGLPQTEQLKRAEPVSLNTA